MVPTLQGYPEAQVNNEKCLGPYQLSKPLKH